MTTTDSLQKLPDYYTSIQDCQTLSKNPPQTNPLYPNFNQINFTAGNEDQFEEYRHIPKESEYNPTISLTENIFRDKIRMGVWPKYRDLKADAVLNTFRYIFYKFKKGIFVKISGGKLRVFLPFSNANFVNEWGDRIHVDPEKFKSMYYFLKHISEMEGYHLNFKRVNKNTSEWYSNSCLVRYEYPLNENDTNVSTLKNMLEELCANRVIPDIEFFINRRDFPILTKDGTEAYDNIWDSDQVPLLSHNYPQYVPIMSMSSTARYADILIPTYEDWARVQSKEGIYFPRNCREYKDNFVDWPEKTNPKAVFRGGSTGCGTTVETNPRLWVSALSAEAPVDENGIPYLDAGITKWNLRPRKTLGVPYLQTIEKDTMPFTLIAELSPEQQAKYKYIINIDGHVSAFRLSLELSTGSVVLLVKSQWKMWFTDILEPYREYVPVKSDMSDLLDVIDWCRNNDGECKNIAKNARSFYDKYLCKNGILDYLQLMLCNVKEQVGTYISEFSLEGEEKIISDTFSGFPDIQKPIKSGFLPLNTGRSFAALEGMRWVFNLLIQDNTGIFDKNIRIFQEKPNAPKQVFMLGYGVDIQTGNISPKIQELIHEAFVGLTCTNNLLHHIPNFMFVFGLRKRNNTTDLFTEKLSLTTFRAWIEGNSFNFKDYCFILVQLCMSLYIAQGRYAFVHNNLTPENIEILTLTNPEFIDYILEYDKTLKVETKIIPVIKGFGRANVVYNGKLYGTEYNPTPTRFQDILTILLTSMDSILKLRTLDQGILQDLFNLINFLANVGIVSKPFTSMQEIKTFLKDYNKKLMGNIIGNISPITFIQHIQKILGNTRKLTYKKVDRYSGGKYSAGNPTQIFDYILSGSEAEKIDSYESVFIKYKHSTIPQPKDLFFLYYCAQTIYENLYSVNQAMKINVARNINIGDKTLQFTENLYRNLIAKRKPEKIEYQVGMVNPEYKAIVEMTLLNEGIFRLPKDIRDFYYQNFSELLKIDSFTEMIKK